MEQRADNKFSLLAETGINYSVSAVLPVLLSLVVLLIAGAASKNYASEPWYIYLSYLVPQIAIFAAAILWFRRSKTPIKTVYCGCKWYYFPLALLLAFGLFSLSELNGLFLSLFERFGYTMPESPLPPLGGWDLLPAILVIALFPAFFEETFFRGIQVGGMRRSGWGVASAALISGALFSLYHANPAQTVYQFACGAAYALVAIASGSVFPTMLAHFANNTVILCLTAAGYESIVPANFALGFYLLSGGALALSLAAAIYLGRGKAWGVKGGKRYLFAAGAGILILAVEWIALFVEGFL